MSDTDKEKETLLVLTLDAITDKLNSFTTPEAAGRYMEEQLARPKEERREETRKELTQLRKTIRRAS